MKLPIWDYGDAADKYIGDIWRIENHLYKGCKVLDIGANRGLVTAICGVNGAIVTAYEANPNAYTYLLQTIDSNGIQATTTAINKAIWTYTGVVDMDRKKPGIQYANSLISSRQDRDYFNAACSDWNIETPCVSFEEAVGDTAWDIVKIDVEGAEFPILLECREKIFEQINYLTVEFHHDKPGEYERLMNRLKKYYPKIEHKEGTYLSK